MSNQNYTIAEEFELPSKGQIYGKSFNPVFRLRPMTVKEEMKRLANKVRPNKTLCEIVDDCLLDEKFPIKTYDLCLGDFEYLLQKLRIITYGPKYKLAIGCPHCGASNTSEFDLDTVEVLPFDLKKFTEAQTFTLPVCGKEITIYFETPRLMDVIDRKVKEFKKKNPSIDYDCTPLVTLSEIIDNVDGNKLDVVELENFVSNLSAKDYNFIMHKYDELNTMVGVNNILTTTCPRCGGEVLSYFRFEEEFFRPSNY